jgi:cell division protein FtsL
MRNNKKKKISLFNVVVSIFLTAAVLVFLVYNIIHVNNLAIEVNNTRTDLAKQTGINNGLMNEIERLSTYDNIKPVAVDKLKLNNPVKKPKMVIVDKSDIESAKQ